MNRTGKMARYSAAAILAFTLCCGAHAQAQAAPAQEGGATKQPYTIAEYNSYQACAAEKNPAQLVKCLDDFSSKYPNSALMIYVYPLYYSAYGQQKNYAKEIEYIDKLETLGDKVDPLVRYGALYNRAVAYNAMNSTDPAQARIAREKASAALKMLPDLKKPENLDEKAFADQKKSGTILLNFTAAQAAMVMKDYPAAVESYKALLALTPDDAVSNYKLGQVYLAMTPPRQMDAFWSIARAVTAKSATEQQSKQVKTYLRKLLVNYQQASCETLIDAELNELLQLAANSPERPTDYKLPSADELTAARKDMTIASVINELKAGGDKAKVTWLASCGLEFPDVPGKLIDIAGEGDAVNLKVAFVTSEAEFQAATTANMDVKIAGQPEAAKLEKGNPVRFTGTLSAYDPDPAFMLHWDKAKVNAEDLPKDKEKKTPTKRAPAKRPVAKKKPAAQ
ncbi:MAG TPA: tetratricopeptide repeat protein [Candidatus Dormibacteraeota bacterium]|nr:tetratricopeptide repeat protein [Candidatus Dormibacteraeota bacterium]